MEVLSEKEEAFNIIKSILDRVPKGQRSDVLLMVGRPYGIGLPTKVHRARTFATPQGSLQVPSGSKSKKELIQELNKVKTLLGKYSHKLPTSHPLVARRDFLLKEISAGRYSFRRQRRDNVSPLFYEEEEAEETSEEGTYSPYGSDGDDSVNRVGP
jgi:hypothetical protein